jgi:hypothetical protein
MIFANAAHTLTTTEVRAFTPLPAGAITAAQLGSLTTAVIGTTQTGGFTTTQLDALSKRSTPARSRSRSTGSLRRRPPHQPDQHLGQHGDLDADRGLHDTPAQLAVTTSSCPSPSRCQLATFSASISYDPKEPTAASPPAFLPWAKPGFESRGRSG